MAPSTRPHEPRVDGDLDELADPALADEVEWRDVRISGDLIGVEADDVEIHGCVLAGVRFTAANLARLRVIDAVLTDCDLSGAALRDASFRRVAFRTCRISGIDLSGARFDDVTFTDCKLDEAHLRTATGARVRFEGCDLRGADLYEVRFEHAALEHCDLSGIEVSKARLGGARLHGSRLDGLRGARHLSGVVIDPTQVVSLALPLFADLGIAIDDGTDAATDESPDRAR